MLIFSLENAEKRDKFSIKMHKIQQKFPEITTDEPLRLYSTFRIGGPADFFYKLKSLEELPALIRFCKENSLPYTIIGGGSNILFPDEGYRGLIIKNECESIEFLENSQVQAASGVRIVDLIKKTLENHLCGLEKWTGLPGTVGGAVRGNAGCNGLETKDILKKATLLNPQTGQIHEESLPYFDYHYRESKLKLKPEIILSATFQLQKNAIPAEKQQEIIAEINKFRVSAQPPGLSSGSFFKNPSPDKPAGMLIDRAGLKGTQIGGAKISEKHANFFLNTGRATAKDMLSLATLAKKTVKEKFDINLEEEVFIMSPTAKTD